MHFLQGNVQKKAAANQIEMQQLLLLFSSFSR